MNINNNICSFANVFTLSKITRELYYLKINLSRVSMIRVILMISDAMLGKKEKETPDDSDSGA